MQGPFGRAGRSMAAIPRGEESCRMQELCQQGNVKSKEIETRNEGTEVQEKVRGHRCGVRKAQRQASLSWACLLKAVIAGRRKEKF